MHNVWVVIPYANEPSERLQLSIDSVRATGARFLWGSHGTLPETINILAAKAIQHGATHVCWLSTGDTLHPDRFSDWDPPEDHAECCYVLVRSRGEVYPKHPDWQERIYRDNQFCGSGMVVPAHIWQSAGGFDESLRYCSDWDFALRVQHEHGWECAPGGVLAWANEYADGITNTADPNARHRDRAKIKKLANRLRKYGK